MPAVAPPASHQPTQIQANSVRSPDAQDAAAAGPFADLLPPDDAAAAAAATAAGAAATTRPPRGGDASAKQTDASPQSSQTSGTNAGASASAGKTNAGNASTNDKTASSQATDAAATPLVIEAPPADDAAASNAATGTTDPSGASDAPISIADLAALVTGLVGNNDDAAPSDSDQKDAKQADGKDGKDSTDGTDDASGNGQAAATPANAPQATVDPSLAAALAGAAAALTLPVVANTPAPAVVNADQQASTGAAAGIGDGKSAPGGAAAGLLQAIQMQALVQAQEQTGPAAPDTAPKNGAKAAASTPQSSSTGKTDPSLALADLVAATGPGAKNAANVQAAQQPTPQPVNPATVDPKHAAKPAANAAQAASDSTTDKPAASDPSQDTTTPALKDAGANAPAPAAAAPTTPAAAVVTSPSAAAIVAVAAVGSATGGAGQAVATSTPTAASGATTPQTPYPVAVPIAAVGIEIAARAQAGNNSFAIRLDPPDLGRIDVRLDVDKDGHVTSKLVADRQETLDLLRRDAPELQRALQDAGLKTNDNTLQFSLRDQGQGFAGREQQSRQNQFTPQVIVPDPSAMPAEAAPRVYGRWLGGSSGVDIRV